MTPDCERCGLTDGPIPDSGGDYSILICGESPGAEEVIRWKPFVGPSGKKLRDALDAIGYPEDETTYTNIVKCRPPNNEMKSKYVKCCYKSLPIKNNTRLVLLLGNIPLKAVLGESGITQWQGVISERDGIIYAPALHPAYFLHRDDPRMFDAWLEALDRALDAYWGGIDLPADAGYEYVYPVTTQHEVNQMCQELMASDRISFDVEFANLDPYADNASILTVSFANDKKAWAVPLDHPDQLAGASEDIFWKLSSLLEKHPCVVGHNIKMDQMQVDALAYCRFDAAGDSMLASFLLESVPGLHKLKRLAGVHLNMADYDAGLQQYVAEHAEANPDRGGSYAKIPLDTLLPYAAKDAAATFQLETVLLEKLTEKQQNLYYELMVPVSNTLYRIQVNGIAVDASVADRYLRLYTTVKEDELNEILNDPHVRTYVEDRKSKLKGVKKERFQFNPGSWQQKADVLYGSEYYGLEPLGKTEKGAPSTRREFLEPYREKCALADKLIFYGMLSKMVSTYIGPVAKGTKLSGDGRARSSFNQHITRTGRLSSSRFNPKLGFNQQNIPVPEKEPGTIFEYQPIKNMFTHTFPDGCLLSVDFSGMELRVFASLAESWDMIDIHKSGKDFHTMICAEVNGKSYDSITKAERHIFKRIHFLMLYGGSEYAINRILRIPLEEGRQIIDRYFRRFPQALKYREECVEFARRHNYIETPFGIRRPLPAIHSRDSTIRAKAEREAANTPTQGAAGMILLMALVIIDDVMREQSLKSMLVNTVHDSILTDVYPGELDGIVKLQLDVMENIIEYAKKYMPNIDLEWLICPLAASAEVGSHYGSLQHYDTERTYLCK